MRDSKLTKLNYSKDLPQLKMNRLICDDNHFLLATTPS